MAPINYQYINQSSFADSYLTKMDLIVPINMDCYGKKKNTEECWNTKNARERLKNTDIQMLTPVSYYSIAQTQNHTYILYSFYHADDTTHPNDMEGCLVILERGDMHKLLGMITVAHHKTPAYSYEKRLTLEDGSKAERLLVEEEEDRQHPLIQQESGKHGMYALGKDTPPEIKIWRTLKIVFGQYQDKIVYYPGMATQYDYEYLKQYRGTPHYPTFYYDLIYIHDANDGLYQRKKSQPNSTFESNGQFHGGAANPPWLWKKDDISLWDSPAKLASSIFRTKSKQFDTKYEIRMQDDIIPKS